MGQGSGEKMKIEQFLIDQNRARIVAQLFEEHEIMRIRHERLTVQIERSEQMIREIQPPPDLVAACY
jgi:chaperonin cofactor prefoldin